MMRAMCWLCEFKTPSDPSGTGHRWQARRGFLLAAGASAATSGSLRQHSQSMMVANTNSIRKMLRQTDTETIQPPTMGAMAGETEKIMVTSDIIFSASAPLYKSRVIARPMTTPAPADTPCSMRKPHNIWTLLAIAQGISVVPLPGGRWAALGALVGVLAIVLAVGGRIGRCRQHEPAVDLHRSERHLREQRQMIGLGSVNPDDAN